MNLRQLRYFCEVVEAGSAAAAAARLHVAPTAISMQIIELEEELGGELFDRSTRPMSLNALGQYFHPRAKELLTESHRLIAETRAVVAGKTGVLAVGYTRSTIFSILPKSIRQFKEAYPDVKVELLAALSEHQHALLQSGRIQIGVSRYLGPVELAEDLTFTHLLDDPFVVTLPSGHPLLEQETTPVGALQDLPLITYPKDPQSDFAQQMIGVLRSGSITPVVAYEGVDIHTALGMVASGLGYTLVGKSVSEGNRSDIAFRPLTGVLDTATVMAVTKRGDNSKVVAAFIEVLANVTATQ
ncbi:MULTISPECIES: LysR family transcriptional regulator [Paraburkholderia]|uniref:LysR family transcriptional regulator n=1 Tax=Paraburkholderia TaxID=1822464 RepID=UPI0006B526B7|nr:MULTISPECIES: LysR family transcriptional regulator [Paraburkholderia]KPD14875.1 LysR family transcriptional regulator [Burkholderia sp. ST111]MBK5153387.1 LysR family transcriptional regulator [Burkholderia sp. R-69608]MBK5186010.1 LysR family transcriptional regulator [Burkholderia sp. R-69749]CAE6898060.1 HTH-type transcriptional regulator BenM [Paraburkholderia domus]CAE6971931.1 HTH-type transcriptional regulator BenM [Paraburkholderia nemoris]